MSETIFFVVRVTFAEQDPERHTIVAVSHRAAAKTVISWHAAPPTLVTVDGGGSRRRYSVTKAGQLRKLAAYTYR